LQSRVDELTEALGEATSSSYRGAKGALYRPFGDLEVIRREAGMPLRRFVARLGSPPRPGTSGAPRRSRPKRSPGGRRRSWITSRAAAAKAYEFSAWGHR